MGDRAECGLPFEVLNPRFDTDTIWVKDPPWTIAGGKAKCSGSGGGAPCSMTQPVYCHHGHVIKIQFEVSGFLMLGIDNAVCVIGNETYQILSAGYKAVWLTMRDAPPPLNRIIFAITPNFVFGNSFTIDNIIAEDLSQKVLCEDVIVPSDFAMYEMYALAGNQYMMHVTEKKMSAKVWIKYDSLWDYHQALVDEEGMP